MKMGSRLSVGVMMSFRGILSLAAFGVGVILAFASPKYREYRAPNSITMDGRLCGTGPADTTISFCNFAIVSGKYKGRNLATLYYNRGNAHHARNDNSNAIADYDKAIELHPRYAAAYVNRGVSYGDQ